MDFSAIKKYPSQISSAFRRFPVATALALVSFAILIINTEFFGYIDIAVGSTIAKFLIWLGTYPVAAMLISLTTSLVQESQNRRSNVPQIVAGVTWFIISAALVFFGFTDHQPDLFANEFVPSTFLVIYVTVFFGLFIAPFWKQKDEDAFWNFLCKNIKALVIGILIAGLLLGSIEALVFAFGQLFDHEFDEKVYLYIFYFCASTVFPILYFAGIPSIRECHEETPTLNKFATSIIKFLFFPVLSLAILLFYAYIVKFIVQWDMPQGMVSYFVSGFMIYMLALVTIMYPTRLGDGHRFEKKLLKIFPAACIPLVVMMSVGLVRRISDYGISTERIFAVTINIYFYIIIAILLTGKIKCKSRYIAVAFCALLFIVTDTPLKASKISHGIWMDSIKSALVEQGYTEFPLNKDDTKEFIRKLKDKNDKNSNLVISRLIEMRSTIPSKTSSDALANYFSVDNSFSIYQIYEKDAQDSDEEEDKTSEQFDEFNISVEYPEKMAFDIPQGAKRAVTVEHNFDDSEFEFRGDTLTFRISLEKDDCGCGESSACADSTADSTAVAATDNGDIYSFTVDRRTLKQDTTKFIMTDRATLAVRYMHVAEWSKTSKDLSIRGILFIE